jgi:hypothetical protein
MNFTGIPSIQDVAAIATAIGVFFAAIQLWHTRNRAVTTFEDSLSSEYRKIPGGFRQRHCSGRF